MEGSEALHRVRYKRNQGSSETGPNTRWRLEVWEVRAGKTDYAEQAEYWGHSFQRWNSCD